MSIHEVKVINLNNYSIIKHPNADSLSLIEIEGYTACIRTDDIDLNVLWAYIEPDYVVPDTEQFSFLKGHRRIKGKKLPGIMSHGLLIKAPEGLQEGDNALEVLGVVRYEPALAPGLKAGKQGCSPPDLIVPVYDLEPWRKNKWMIKEGDFVSISEKLHGCVPSYSGIVMADGSRSTMSKIKIGDYVMGVNSEGNICASKVLNKFNNGPATEGWLNIKGDKRKAGKGPSEFSLTCTPNHQVWCVNRDKYIDASDLQIGDTLLTQRTDLGLSNIRGEYKPNLVEVTINSIICLPQIAIKSEKWDIETETHNYIANSILVHNSNFRAVYYQDKLWVGSRTTWREQDSSNTFWQAVKDNWMIEQWCRDNPGLVLFGEIFGKIQDLRYGMPEDKIGFRAFDVWDPKKSQYWTIKQFNEWFDIGPYCLYKVPILYEGPFNVDIMLSLVDGKTLIKGASHIREGIVIKSNNEVGRVALKFVSDNYLERTK